MKIKSLLAAVSMAAITSGAAHALSIPPMSVTPTGVVLAEELALPADLGGNFAFSVVTDSGEYPAGNNFIVAITLPDGVGIDTPVLGSVLTAPLGGSAVVQSQSGSEVELFVSIPQNVPGGISALDFSIPVELTSCDIFEDEDANDEILVTVETEGGTPVEDGSAEAASPIEGCASAFDTTFGPDADNTIIALDDFIDLRNDPMAAGTVLTSPVGLFDARVNTGVVTSLALGNLRGRSVDEVTFDIVLQDGSAVDDITVGGVSGTPSADGNTYSFEIPFASNIADSPIVITVAGDEVIESQPITVTNVVHVFSDRDGFDLIDLEPGAGGPLDRLDREGQSFGVFDWNSGPLGAQTVSVYRITGLEPGVQVRYTATIWNSEAEGGAAFVLPGETFVTGNDAGEAILTNVLDGIPADVTRYDLGLNFETGEDLDVDRLMSRDGIITTFGGGANLDSNGLLQMSPSRDADNNP